MKVFEIKKINLISAILAALFFYSISFIFGLVVGIIGNNFILSFFQSIITLWIYIVIVLFEAWIYNLMAKKFGGIKCYITENIQIMEGEDTHMKDIEVKKIDAKSMVKATFYVLIGTAILIVPIIILLALVCAYLIPTTDFLSALNIGSAATGGIIALVIVVAIIIAVTIGIAIKLLFVWVSTLIYNKLSQKFGGLKLSLKEDYNEQGH